MAHKVEYHKFETEQEARECVDRLKAYCSPADDLYLDVFPPCEYHNHWRVKENRYS